MSTLGILSTVIVALFLLLLAVATKIVNAEGESLAAAALGDASDTMMAHPLAFAAAEPPELGRDRGRQEHDRCFPRPLMTTIADFGAFLARESAAASHSEPPSGNTEKPVMKPVAVVPSNGKVGAGTGII